MPFVVDASVAAAWILPDEANSLADAARQVLPDEAAIAPAIWWFEIRNLLVMAERRKRIGHAEIEDALGILRILPIARDDEPDDANVVRLARTHGLTVYDSAYLELALRRGLRLATLDGLLIKAAVSERCALFTGT